MKDRVGRLRRRKLGPPLASFLASLGDLKISLQIYIELTGSQQPEVRKVNPDMNDPCSDNPDNVSSAVNPATTATTKSRQQVLLQTAVTYAHATGHCSNPVPIRVILDSGSRRTYITDSLKRRLGQVPRKTETFNLNTFDDERFTKQRCGREW